MPESNHYIKHWLLVCWLLIFLMVVLGGVTRLTGSGLSMVNWQPIQGVLPPLTEQQWQAAFGDYQSSPEFQKKNTQMDIEAFRSIYWFEYAHRLLGRLIAMVFLIPFLYFFWTRQIKPGLTAKLLLIFVLGGLQGLLGWYMVKSGLVDRPEVSQYRLAAHLLSAMLISGFVLWVMLDLARKRSYCLWRQSAHQGWRIAAVGVTGLLLVTIVSGAFVAGLKAGLIYNSFPLMGGEWVPEGLSVLSPWYKNLFENRITVQFDHRLLAGISVLLLVVWSLLGRKCFHQPAIRRSFNLVGLGVVLQFALGVATLLSQVQIGLAVMHQAGGLLLFSALVSNMHALSRQ